MEGFVLTLVVFSVGTIVVVVVFVVVEAISTVSLPFPVAGTFFDSEGSGGESEGVIPSSILCCT